MSIDLEGKVSGSNVKDRTYSSAKPGILRRAITSCNESNAHVADLVRALEPTPSSTLGGVGTFVREATPSSTLGGVGAFVRLNRCLPIYHGFYPSTKDIEKTRHKPTVDVERKKDACESCGITSAETALRYVPALDMTICWREYQVYARSGRLKPVKNKYRVQIGALADHCESCGVTDEPLCWHPDIDDMTICIREAGFYHRNGRLRPQRHVPKWEMAKQCESCGVTDEPLCRHPDGSLQMTICVREWQYYRRHSVLCPERVRAQWALADHCESCGATDVQLVRHPDDSLRRTICRREYDYYQLYGHLKPGRN